MLGAEEIRKNRRGKVEASLRLGGKVSPLGKKRALGAQEIEGERWKQACDLPKKSACRGEENFRGEKGRMDTGLLLVLKVGVPF